MIETFVMFLGAKTLPGAIITLSAVVGALIALFVYGRKGFRKYRSFKNKLGLAYDSIVGDEAIIDPQTGKVLVAARSPIGTRVAVLEDALTSIAESLERMTAIEETLASIVASNKERDLQGQQIIDEWTEWREEFKSEKVNEHERIWEAIDSLKPQP